MRIHGLVALIALSACGGASQGNTPDAAATGADASAAPSDAGAADAAGEPGPDAAAPDAPVTLPPDAAAADAPMTEPPDAAAPDAPMTEPPDAAPPDAPPPDAGVSPVEPTAMRVDFLALRDPHGFFLGCNDVTDPPGLFGLSVNGTVDETLNQDGDDDDLLDLSIVMRIDELTLEDGARRDVELLFADCTAPAAETTCSAGPEATRLPGTITNQADGTCLDVVAGTLSPGDVYAEGYPPVAPATAGAEPCFVSDAQTLTLPVAGAEITLEEARFAARYVDGGVTGGLIRGFISEADAEATSIPLPIFGPTPLSELLWGGEGGGCEVDDDDPTPGDIDVGPDGETLGWWFYLAFTAEEVPFEEP